jgi:hypothetical protein
MARPDLHVPDSVAELVMQLLEKKREARPPSARAVIEAIDQAENGSRGPRRHDHRRAAQRRAAVGDGEARRKSWTRRAPRCGAHAFGLRARAGPAHAYRLVPTRWGGGAPASPRRRGD